MHHRLPILLLAFLLLLLPLLAWGSGSIGGGNSGGAPTTGLGTLTGLPVGDGAGNYAPYAGSSCGTGTKAVSSNALGVLACTPVSLTADVAGVGGVANGMTGAATFTAGLLYSPGTTTALSSIANVAAGQVLVSGTPAAWSANPTLTGNITVSFADPATRSFIVKNTTGSQLGRFTSLGDTGGILVISENGVYSGSGSAYTHDDAALSYWDFAFDPRVSVDKFKLRRAPIGASTNIVNLLQIDAAGNLLVGEINAGASAARTLAVASGTCPTTAPPDMGQVCVTDIAGAGTAGWRFFDEGLNAFDLGNGQFLAPKIVSTGVVKTGGSVVASLPTCNAGARGSLYYVTDALAPAFLSTIVGGGAIVAPVFCDGTNWVGA